VAAILRHGAPELVDICLANSAAVRPGLVERYQAEDAVPITVDRAAVEALGVELIQRPLSSETSDFARHSVTRLAQAILEIYHDRAETRLF
jgi:hypothetical protein